jgi:hypothetical protein
MPEPPDAAWVVVGDDPYVLLIRDDHSAHEGGNPPGHHWFLAHDGSEPPLSWGQLTGPQPVSRWLGADRSVIQRVYAQAELDEAVALARRKAQITPVGEHLIEPRGYCRTCGVRHSTVEIARLEDRLAAETAAETPTRGETP